jgi:LysM repeat protein
MLGLSSCASRADSWRRAETEKITRGEFLLSATNAQPGESYEVLVYVVASGDTLSSISRRFGCTVQDLKTLNPDLAASSPPLKVGQKLRVREARRGS